MATFTHSVPTMRRSDSRDPRLTCAGTTTNGRLCRRTLSPPGIAETTKDGDMRFCWQHKQQGVGVTVKVPTEPLPRRTDKRLQHRHSIETMVDRLAGFHIDKSKDTTNTPRVPAARNDGSGQSKRPVTTSQRSGLWNMLCCAGSLPREDDYFEVVRHRSRQNTHARQTTNKQEVVQRNKPLAISSSALANPTTKALLSLLPKSISPLTTSLLLAELSKPLSSFDGPGFIYVYLLTSDGVQPPPPSDVETLLCKTPASPWQQQGDSPVPHHDAQERQVQIQRYASIRRPNSKQRKLLVKIGRTNNVQRRLQQWTKQCNQNVTLIRYYPHVSTSHGDRRTSSSAPSTPAGVGSRRVPFSHRVERLIHLELSDQQVSKDKCSECGREHREWFEIDASEDSLGKLDSLIKRWVAYADGMVAVSKPSEPQQGSRVRM